MRFKEKSAALFGGCGFFCIFVASFMKEQESVRTGNGIK